MVMAPQLMMDLGVASLIVVFSSTITYGIINWFRKTKSKKEFI
jgi:hypothetical protein